MTDDHKFGSYEETVLQSKIGKSFNSPIQQTSLPKPPPLLEFKRQKDEIKKSSEEQKMIYKAFLDNDKENTIGMYIQKAIIQFPLNTDKVIDYYRQISQPLIQLYLDSLKIQKDYINAFQPQWVSHIRTMVENYLLFQDKMILLFIENYNVYLKNVFDIKIRQQQKNEGERGR